MIAGLLVLVLGLLGPAGPPRGPSDPAVPVPVPAAVPAPVPAPAPAPALVPPPGRTAVAPLDVPVAISTRIEPDPSNIGDLLRYEVVAAYPRGYSVNLPIGITLDPLHRVSVTESEPEATGQGLRKVFTFEVQAFSVGELEVPGFPLTYVNEGGEVHTVDVPPHSFVVDSLLANEVDPQRKLEDPPISIEYPNTLAETIIFSSLAAFAVAFVLWIILRSFTRRKRPVFIPPPIPAHETALAALLELEGGDLVKNGEFQTYYLQLTEIAKGYLEGRFGLDALDRTTDEIRRSLVGGRTRIGVLDPDEVIGFLQDCDLVKFARFSPTPDEAGEALERVRTMVERSRPVIATPKQAAPGADADAGSPPGEPGQTSGSSGSSGSSEPSESSVPESGDASAEPDPPPAEEPRA